MAKYLVKHRNNFTYPTVRIYRFLLCSFDKYIYVEFMKMFIIP